MTTAKGMIEVVIEVVPTDGSPIKKSVEVPATHAKLSDVLVAAGIVAEKRDLYLNGQPATLETAVASGGKITLKNAPPPQVRVAERPSGS